MMPERKPPASSRSMESQPEGSTTGGDSAKADVPAILDDCNWHPF